MLEQEYQVVSKRHQSQAKFTWVTKGPVKVVYNKMKRSGTKNGMLEYTLQVNIYLCYLESSALQYEIPY